VGVDNRSNQVPGRDRVESVRNDFEVQTWETADAYGRLRIRLKEMGESLKIVEQRTDRLTTMDGRAVMVADKKIGWPSRRPTSQHAANSGCGGVDR
jgi:NADH:ubiquinone oxidoreductase subunit D